MNQAVTETWVVAHDLSPASDRAAAEAARLTQALGATLRLFHAHQAVHLPSHQAWGDETLALEKELRAQLEQVKAKLTATYPKLNVEVVVATGDPIVAILNDADRPGVTTIVMGTHGRKGVAHALLGSVAERLVRESRLPVLVVRQQEG